jgi:hypothetical protein
MHILALLLTIGQLISALRINRKSQGMSKKEKTLGETTPKEHKPLDMGALARLLPPRKAPKPKLTRREKRRKKS